jgi:hypothetical protein
MPLSKEEKDALLSAWKADMEQGLLSPNLKPSFLGVDVSRFSCSGHIFGGIRLPEFCCISWNVLDCFATALISSPGLEFPASPLLVRCRLGEGQNNQKLTLYLSAMLAVGEQILPLGLSEEWEVWIASQLRPLAKTKEIALGNIFWDRTGLDSFFFFDYPGKMVRDKVPGLGAPGEDGKPSWPECHLLLDPVSANEREMAKRGIDFVRSTPDGPIQ